MSEEDVNPSYLIHSDVFPSTDDHNDDESAASGGLFMQHSIDFLLPRRAMNQFDDDGDLLIERPERLHLTLGICLFTLTTSQIRLSISEQRQRSSSVCISSDQR